MHCIYLPFRVFKRNILFKESGCSDAQHRVAYSSVSGLTNVLVSEGHQPLMHNNTYSLQMVDCLTPLPPLAVI